MNITKISKNDLRHMKGKEGLILQGCGGEISEWVDGVNLELKGKKILLGNTKFEDVCVFKHKHATCILYPFDDRVKLDMGKLAMWRLKTKEQFGSTWLSDFVNNELGGFEVEKKVEEEPCKPTTYKITIIGDREVEVTPKVQLYNVKDFMGKDMHSLAITFDWINPESNMLEPYAMFTKSFGEFIGVKNCTYIDTNNCPFAEQLLKYGIAKDTGFTKDSGFCKYPLWQFNEEFLKEHGAENYKLYCDEFAKYQEMMGDFCEGEDEEPNNIEEPDIKM